MGSITLGIVVVILGYILNFLASQLDILTPNIQLNDSSCEIYESLQGPGDFEIYSNFIISGVDDRFPLLQDEKAVLDAKDGKLILFDTQADKITTLKLQDFPKDRLAFHPAGMYNMDHILYVVNHASRRGGERIEKFSISKTGSMFSILGSDHSLELKWEESILLPDNYMGMFNDIVFVSQDEFYATTWSSSKNNLTDPKKEPIDTFFKLFYWLYTRSTYLLKCKVVKRAAECSILDSGYMMSGVLLADNKLFATDKLAKKLFVYMKNTAEGFKKVREIDLPIYPDNIMYSSEDRRLYIGGYRQKYGLVFPSLDRELPGQINGVLIKLDTKNYGIELAVSTNKYTGVSVGTKLNGRVFLGSWYQKGILVCPE